MGKNINQLTTAAASVLATDKLYLGRSPFGLTDDRYILGSSIISQFATVASLGTMAFENSNSISISGGSIDGTTLGATTPAAATFTSLLAKGGAASAYFPLIKSYSTDGTNAVVQSNTPAVVHALNGTTVGVLNVVGDWAEYEMLATIVTPVAADNILFNPQYNSGTLISFNPSTSFIVPSSPSSYYDVSVKIRVNVISPLSGNTCTYAFKYRIEVLDPNSLGTPAFLYTGSAYRNSTTLGTGILFQTTINPGSSSVINAESAILTGVA